LWNDSLHLSYFYFPLVLDGKPNNVSKCQAAPEIMLDGLGTLNLTPPVDLTDITQEKQFIWCDFNPREKFFNLVFFCTYLYSL
jgi:hypothetical protein